MDANIIDWSKISISQEGRISLIYYAFLGLSTARDNGQKIEEFKITDKGREVLTEEGFREFLKTVSAVDYNEKNLTGKQRLLLNDIKMYLFVEPTPVPTEGNVDPVRLADLIPRPKV